MCIRITEISGRGVEQVEECLMGEAAEALSEIPNLVKISEPQIEEI